MAWSWNETSTVSMSTWESDVDGLGQGFVAFVPVDVRHLAGEADTFDVLRVQVDQFAGGRRPRLAQAAHPQLVVLDGGPLALETCAPPHRTQKPFVNSCARASDRPVQVAAF